MIESSALKLALECDARAAPVATVAFLGAPPVNGIWTTPWQVTKQAGSTGTETSTSSRIEGYPSSTGRLPMQLRGFAGIVEVSGTRALWGAPLEYQPVRGEAGLHALTRAGVRPGDHVPREAIVNRLLLAALLVTACSRDARPTVAPTPPLANQLASPAIPPQCTRELAMRQITLPRGQETELALDLRATYHGSSHDHYDDGSTTLKLALEFVRATRESWLPDWRDHTLHHIAGRCMRVVTSTAGEVVLEVEITKPPAAELRCHGACCTTEASRQPAPGGEVECCICNDGD